MSPRRTDPLRAALLGLLLAGTLGACQDTLARQETITLSAGEAVAANKAIHVIDPWPAASADARIQVSGRRVADAIERYETRATDGEGLVPPPGAAVPVAP